MASKTVLEAIKSITSGNGFVYSPSVVTDKPTKALRGVQVTTKGDKTEVTINASGKCLESLKRSIRNVVGESVTFTDETKTSQPKEDKSDGTH